MDSRWGENDYFINLAFPIARAWVWFFIMFDSWVLISCLIVSLTWRWRAVHSFKVMLEFKDKALKKTTSFQWSGSIKKFFLRTDNYEIQPELEKKNNAVDCPIQIVFFHNKWLKWTDVKSYNVEELFVLKIVFSRYVSFGLSLFIPNLASNYIHLRD